MKPSVKDRPLQTKNARGKTLMVQGCTSDSGKSTIVAGLCRALLRRNISVAPFKPQNMALNSAVTADGGEIGRAQAMQARACKIAPVTDMNPVLLKPNSDTGAQVIVQGKAGISMEAKVYHHHKPKILQAVLESHQRLENSYSLVMVEGAGSPAEINLREHDIANMGFAEAVDCPVILCADIDKGGVFAHLVGTIDVLEPSEQARIKGFIINKFRGDIALLEPGLHWLEQRTGKPVLGVLPFLQGLHLEAEDAVDTQQIPAKASDFTIAVPRFSRISNHTDFDPLRMQSGINIQFITRGMPLPPCDLVILPGSKNVALDMRLMREQGWDKDLAKHLRYGGKVLGICGGFQMLGQSISDPEEIESTERDIAGLGLLDFDTTLMPEKTLTNVNGRISNTISAEKNASVIGYEIHAGISEGRALDKPFIELENLDSTFRNEGALSDDGQIAGTYLHGLFDSDEGRNAILSWAGVSSAEEFNYTKLLEDNIERLADSIEDSIDIDAVLNLLAR